MDTRRFCVYNETNECFLSLGITLGNNTRGQLKALIGKGPLQYFEGSWIKHPRALNTLGLITSRALMYLDKRNSVVHLTESLPRLRVAPFHPQAASLLALPASTIESSQTQVQDQLVICGTEDMQVRLRSMDLGSDDIDLRPAIGPSEAVKNWVSQQSAKDRRSAPRNRWPHLEAFDTEGNSVVAHAVRDISTTGIYLITDERWPLGTRVRMSLQRTNGFDDASMIPTTVELRVSRWGADGVGLEFVTADVEHSALVSMHVR